MVKLEISYNDVIWKTISPIITQLEEKYHTKMPYHHEALDNICEGHGTLTFTIEMRSKKNVIALAKEMISKTGVPVGRFVFPPIYSPEDDAELVKKILDGIDASEEYKKMIIRGNEELAKPKESKV